MGGFFYCGIEWWCLLSSLIPPRSKGHVFYLPFLLSSTVTQRGQRARTNFSLSCSRFLSRRPGSRGRISFSLLYFLALPSLGDHRTRIMNCFSLWTQQKDCHGSQNSWVEPHQAGNRIVKSRTAHMAYPVDHVGRA